MLQTDVRQGDISRVRDVAPAWVIYEQVFLGNTSLDGKPLYYLESPTFADMYNSSASSKQKILPFWTGYPYTGKSAADIHLYLNDHALQSDHDAGKYQCAWRLGS